MMKQFEVPKGCTICETVHSATEHLKKCNIDNADYDSFSLFAFVTGMNRTQYFVNGNKILSEEDRKKFEDVVSMRAEHIPLQHIMGKTWFYGHEFIVSRDCLIPRPDTEILVEEVLKELPENARVMDMCTGSGCILVTIALERKIDAGYGVDLSDKALNIAMQNKDKYQLQNVTLIRSDIFDSVDISQCGNLDLIVSNPPYIRSDVIPTLSKEVRLYDPMMALDGFEDGLFFYRKITEQAGRYLKNGGWLMYEIGYDQAEDVKQIMNNCGFTDVRVVKDLAGLDRVVCGRLL